MSNSVAPRTARGEAAGDPFRRCFTLPTTCGALLVIALLLTSAPDAQAVDDFPRLVRQLGSERFADRQQAQRLILDNWPELREQLEAAPPSADPEVRNRLDDLRSRVQTLHYTALLEELLAEPPRPAPEGLPLWGSYVLLVGDDQAARVLYREMLLEERELMTLLDRRDETFTTSLQQRLETVQRAQQWRRYAAVEELTPANLAVLLLISIEIDGASNPDLMSAIDFQIGDVPLPESKPDADAPERPLIRLVKAWVQSPHAGSPSQRLRVGQNLMLPESVDPAREALLDGRATAVQRKDAILVLARFGDLEHVADLEPFLKDDTRLEESRRRGQPETETRIQDVALIALLHITGQDPAQYGFDALRPDPRTVYLSQSVGFADDKVRQAQLLKWRHWQAQHLRWPAFGTLDAMEGVTL